MPILNGGKNVSIVQLGPGNSTSLYRASGLKEQLEFAGFQVGIYSAQTMNTIPNGSVVVFQRYTPMNDQGKDAFLRVKQRSRAVIFDVDDYLTSVPDLPPSINRVAYSPASAAIIWMMQQCHLTMVSTPDLKEVTERELKVPVMVRRNVLMQRHLELGLTAMRHRPPHVTIGYCCGSGSHDLDFLEAMQGLTRILKEYQTVYFHSIGRLTVPSSFARQFASRVKHSGFVDYERLSESMRSKLSIVIAPLQPTKFNACKSNVKVLEAGAVSLPIVCSNSAQYLQTLTHTQDGFLAKTPDEWYQSLRNLVVSHGQRDTLGKNARRLVEARFSTRNIQDVQAIFPASTTVFMKARPLEPVEDLPRPAVFVPPPPGEDRALTPNLPVRKTRLKILGFRWHVGHQWELHHLPADFTLVHAPTSMAWDYRSRPLRDNVLIVPEERVLDLNDFDLAILHFDEFVLNPLETKGILHPGWGTQFLRYLKTLTIPKVAICHGTVPRMGTWDMKFSGNPWDINEPLRQRFVELLGDTLVICNSHQAKKDWGFKNCRVIHHGFDAKEYPEGTHQKPILTAAHGFHLKPWYQGWPYFKKALDSGLPIDVLGGVVPNFKLRYVSVPEPQQFKVHHNVYAVRKFESYKKTLGEYAVYFSPTWFSPMPRTRAEAMLTGACLVTTAYQDEADWLKNKETGFFSNDPEELVQYLSYLVKNPRVAQEVGRAGRLLASNIFTRERFLREWKEVLKGLV